MVLVVNSSRRHPTTNINQLKGEKIAVASGNSMMGLEFFLTRGNNLDLDDVEVVTADTHEESLNALLNGDASIGQDALVRHLSTTV